MARYLVALVAKDVNYNYPIDGHVFVLLSSLAFLVMVYETRGVPIRRSLLSY